MRDKLFLGSVRQDEEILYRIIDCSTFKITDYRKRDLRQVLKSLKNAFIDREGGFHTTDGLTYGFKSNIEDFNMNTYTIIGYSMGYFIIVDFEGKEWFALSSREMSMNRHKFVGKIFTNAFIYPSIDGVMLNITPINNSFVDVVGECSLSCNEYDGQKGFEFMRELIKLRYATIHSGKFNTYKTDTYTLNILNSNLESIAKILDNKYFDKREMLEEYLLKQPKDGRPILERIYMNTSILSE